MSAQIPAYREALAHLKASLEMFSSGNRYGPTRMDLEKAILGTLALPCFLSGHQKSAILAERLRKESEELLNKMKMLQAKSTELAAQILKVGAVCEELLELDVT